MGTSIVIWATGAVLLFWATGAYNRLIRLRAACILAYSELDIQLVRYPALISAFSPADRMDTMPVVLGLLSAAKQFDESRKAVQARPLDPLAMDALATAYTTLLMSWAKLCSEPPDLAGNRLPDNLYQKWQTIGLACESARLEFNRCVSLYNRAIVQLPARGLAWVFGFKAARMLEAGH